MSAPTCGPLPCVTTSFDPLATISASASAALRKFRRCSAASPRSPACAMAFPPRAATTSGLRRVPPSSCGRKLGAPVKFADLVADEPVDHPGEDEDRKQGAHEHEEAVGEEERKRR